MSDTALLLVAAALFYVGYRAVARWLERRGDDLPAPRPDAAEPDRAPWYRVLEVAPDADVDTLRAAYRRLIGQYHPDKVATLGTELQALAQSKSVEIAAAYREGLRARGVAD